MIKRFLALMLAMVMITMLWVIPTSASMSSTKVFSVDYRDASSFIDRTGNLDLQNLQGAAIDSVLYAENNGIHYANFGSLGSGNCRYMYQNGNYQVLNSVYTMEAYVYLNQTVQSNTVELFLGGDDPFAKLFWDNGHFAFGCTDYSVTVRDPQTRFLQNSGWYHVAVTNDGSKCTLYVNGQAVGTSGSVRMDGLWYLYLSHTALDGYGIALYNIYNTAATASQITELYQSCVSIPVTPTETPAMTPSAKPSAGPVLSNAYQINAAEVPSFKAGDIVNIKFNITDIKAEGGLCGLDLILKYNTSLLSPNMIYNAELGGDVLCIDSSAADINNSSGSLDCYWWALGRLSKQDNTNSSLILTMLEDNGNYSISENGRLWISVAFTAIADSKVGDLLVNVTRASGADLQLMRVEGMGGSVYAAEEIHEKEERSLIISSKPTKLTYDIGEPIDLSGMATAISINGIRVSVNINQCTIEGFDSGKEGNCVVTVSYETDDAIYKNRFTVKITNAKGILALGIAAKPAKLHYVLGDDLDLSGLMVRAKCNDGTIIYLTPEELTVTGYDSSVLGIQKIMLTYKGCSNSFSIKVTEYPIPVGIRLLSKPSKLVYSLGENLNTAGLSVLAVYADGTSEILGPDNVIVRGYRNYIIGIQKVIVEYRTATYSFSVRVNGELGIYNMTLISKPSKLIYNRGEALDLTGLVVKVWYNDDTSIIVGAEDLEISGYDPNAPGVQKLSASYNGHSAQFSVRVN